MSIDIVSGQSHGYFQDNCIATGDQLHMVCGVNIEKKCEKGKCVRKRAIKSLPVDSLQNNLYFSRTFGRFPTPSTTKEFKKCIIHVADDEYT